MEEILHQLVDELSRYNPIIYSISSTFDEHVSSKDACNVKHVKNSRQFKARLGMCLRSDIKKGQFQ